MENPVTTPLQLALELLQSNVIILIKTLSDAEILFITVPKAMRITS